MEAHAAVPKRKRADTALPMPVTPISPTFATDQDVPSQVVTCCDEGDAIVVVHGVLGRSTRIGLRVSTEVLSFTSPVFKRLLTEAPILQNDGTVAKPTKLLTLTDDPGTALCTLINVLHLRNQALPSRMEPNELSRYVEVAVKYCCIAAACRATSPWFDYIFTRHPNPPLYQMVQAAFVMGDATYFARFSSRWVLHEPLSQQTTPTIPLHKPYHTLSEALLRRQKDAMRALRVDIDDLVNPLADSLAKEFTHYVDSPPGDDPVPVDLGGDEDPEVCEVDKEGAIQYLAALRDAKLWPSNQFPWPNLLGVTEAVAKLRIPDYDVSQACHFCANVVSEFADAMDLVKADHQDRLWGLCLECYSAKKLKDGECTYEHEKPADNITAMRMIGDVSGH